MGRAPRRVVVDDRGRVRRAGGSVALGRRKSEADGYGGAVLAENFDGKLDARNGFLRGRERKKEREEEESDEKSVPHFAC